MQIARGKGRGFFLRPLATKEKAGRTPVDTLYYELLSALPRPSGIARTKFASWIDSINPVRLV